MRKLWVVYLCIFMSACFNPRAGWKTISIGKYLIDVPNEFNLKFEKGIDTQPGVLISKDFNLEFDYGAYCDSLVMSPEEYLRKGIWKYDMIIKYISFKMHPDIDWVKTRVLSTRHCVNSDSAFARGCDLIATCAYKNDTFLLPVFIPQEIKNHIVKIDTFEHCYRRRIYVKKDMEGLTGIYMRDERGNLFNGLEYPQIVIGTRRKLNTAQQSLASEIYDSLRPKK